MLEGRGQNRSLAQPRTAHLWSEVGQVTGDNKQDMEIMRCAQTLCKQLMRLRFSIDGVYGWNEGQKGKGGTCAVGQNIAWNRDVPLGRTPLDCYFIGYKL